MPQPLSDAVVATLKTDACAALAAIMVISKAHSELLAWAQRALSPLNVVRNDAAENPAEPEEKANEAKGASEEGAENSAAPLTSGQTSKREKRKAAKLNGGHGAYHARRRDQRDADDERLIEAMKQAPGASVREWGRAIGKCRTATVEALHRLRDAGLIESDDGNWALVEPHPAASAPRWVEPLSGDRVARHAADGRVRHELASAPSPA